MSKNIHDKEKLNGVDISYNQEDVIVKENFCGACLALPLAFAGAGTATATSGDSNGSNGQSNNIFFWSVVITIVGLIATFWFLSGDCESCTSPSLRNSRRNRSGMSYCSNN